MTRYRWLAAALAVGVLAVGVRAADPPKPADDDPFAGALRLLENQPGIDAEQLRDIRRMMELFDRQAGRLGQPRGRAADDMRRQMDELRRLMAGFDRLPDGRAGRPATPAVGELRLGLLLAKPADVVVEQLDLPKDHGLVIDEVMPGTPAAQAGLKAHDILLELGGKPVPSDLKQFAELCRGLKAGEAVEAVVLRKGRRETVAGLKPTEAKVEAPADEDRPARGPARLPGGLIRFPDLGGAFGGGDVVVQGGGKFTVYSQAGDVKLTVIGKVVDGKRVLEKAIVEDGDETVTADSLDKVPEAQRDAVRRIVEGRR